MRTLRSGRKNGRKKVGLTDLVLLFVVMMAIFVFFSKHGSTPRQSKPANVPAHQKVTTQDYSENGSTQRPSRPANVPSYQIVATEDCSVGPVRRIVVRVSLPEHYPRDRVEQVARAIVADITGSQQVNAISIFFYGPHTSTRGIYDVAAVDWAPNGRWEDAFSVEAGDYSTFRYSISYNPPPPALPPDAVRLTASGRTGLLGVPLPTGATLVERTPGDPAAGRDPRERYVINASAAEIMAFFNEAMPKAGWLKDGPSELTYAFFRKGQHIIGIFTNEDGGEFRLMGS